MAIPASRQIPRITKKFFRNPVGNSNGLEENGVQIVKLIVDLYLNSAKMMDITIKMNALINSPLTHRKNTKGKVHNKFSVILIEMSFFSLKQRLKKSFRFISESLPII